MPDPSSTDTILPAPTLPAPADLQHLVIREGDADFGILDQNPAAVYLAGLSTAISRETMRRALDTLAGMLMQTINEKGNPAGNCFVIRWQDVRFQHVNALKSVLNERYKPATVNKYLTALRGVLTAAKQLGLMRIEDHDRATSIKSVKGSTLPAGRNLSDKEVRRLFAVCESDRSPAGVRDAAIFGVLRVGLRVSEAVALDIQHLDTEHGVLKITGKGNKERIVPLAEGSFRALEDWLRIRGDDPGRLFVQVNKGGNIVYKGISRQAVFKICSKRAQQAKIEDFSPHDFRRTFVGDLLDAGADIVTVKDLAGHASIQTTARYDRRDQQRLFEAVRLLHTPYSGGKKT